MENIILIYLKLNFTEYFGLLWVYDDSQVYVCLWTAVCHKGNVEEEKILSESAKKKYRENVFI